MKSDKKGTPTIYDVARLAGVSISTVSRVLNQPNKVNVETREGVLSAIQQLQFVPKADARARAMHLNQRIGVITPYFTAPAFVQRLRGVTRALRSTPSELVIYTVDSAQVLRHYLESLPLTHYLDGLIILSLEFDDRFAQRIVAQGLETVLVEYPHKVLSSVEIDDFAGGRLAAEYLTEKGHRHLGFVGDTIVPEFGIHPITRRLAGFRARLAEQQLDLHPEDVQITTYDVDATRQKAREFLAQPGHPTAYFAATDLQALGILKAARDLGLRIPQDVAVLGFDDVDVAEYIGLSTVCQHLDESGRIAVEILFSRLTDPTRPVQHIELPLNIIERETT